MTTDAAAVEVEVQDQPQPDSESRLGNSDWPQAQVEREIRPAPDRYRNVLGKYKIDRLARCVSCGRCVEVCQYGVHQKPEGYAFTLRPQDHLCVGPECAKGLAEGTWVSH